MASLSRTAMLRQSQLLLASRRLSASRGLATQALQQRPSSISQRSQPSVLSTAPRLAPFSTSSQKRIMPPGPQVIEGGVNEPASIPKHSPLHGSYHWTAERALSLGLVPLTIVPFVSGSLNPALDALFVFVMIVHSHMGFQNCITDYFSVRKHPTIRKASDWLLNIATVLVAIGFYEFETNDVGITEGIRRVWTAGKDPKEKVAGIQAGIDAPVSLK